MSFINELSSALHGMVPVAIGLNAILFSILFFINWKHIQRFLSEVDKATWAILGIIFASALLIRVFIPPIQHIVYVDEAWYMEAAKNMLQLGHHGQYPKSIGWPFILSVFFKIFGISNWVALYAAVCIGALTTLAIFLMAFAITNKKSIGLMSALMIAVYPVHIKWSACAETNIPSLFFVCLTLFFNFIYFRKRTLSLLWLSLASLAFVVQIRPENHILLGIFLLGCFVLDGEKGEQKKVKYILPWIVFGILCIPNLVQVAQHYLSINFIESDSSGTLSGANWGLTNLINNSLHYGGYLFNSEFQPAIISAFVLLGVAIMFLNQRKELLLMCLWFFLLWGFFFSSWMQTLGGSTLVWAKSRYFMSFYPVFVVLASSGFVWLADMFSGKTKNLLIKRGCRVGAVIVVLLSVAPYGQFYSQKSRGNTYLLETKIPELAEKDIPSHCAVLAHWPTVLRSTTDLKVFDARKFFEEPGYQTRVLNATGCLLFFEDLMCELSSSDGRRCQRIKEEFQVEEVLYYQEYDKKYSFYKIGKANLF